LVRCKTSRSTTFVTRIKFCSIDQHPKRWGGTENWRKITRHSGSHIPNRLLGETPQSQYWGLYIEDQKEGQQLLLSFCFPLKSGHLVFGHKHFCVLPNLKVILVLSLNKIPFFWCSAPQ
jgi:hypothetical protein